MTKGELLKVLAPFDDDIKIYRPVANIDGEECGETPITRVEYNFQSDEAKITLR